MTNFRFIPNRQQQHKNHRISVDFLDFVYDATLSYVYLLLSLLVSPVILHPSLCTVPLSPGSICLCLIVSLPLFWLFFLWFFEFLRICQKWRWIQTIAFPSQITSHPFPSGKHVFATGSTRQSSFGRVNGKTGKCEKSGKRRNPQWSHLRYNMTVHNKKSLRSFYSTSFIQWLNYARFAYWPQSSMDSMNPSTESSIHTRTRNRLKEMREYRTTSTINNNDDDCDDDDDEKTTKVQSFGVLFSPVRMCCSIRGRK